MERIILLLSVVVMMAAAPFFVLGALKHTGIQAAWILAAFFAVHIAAGLIAFSFKGNQP